MSKFTDTSTHSMMSGSPGVNFNTKSDLVANNTEVVAREAGCVPNKDVVACLREAPADLLTNISVSMSRAARPPLGEGFFYPTYDGDYVPDRPSLLVRAGKLGAKNMPLVAAWVANDGAWYAPPTTANDADVLASFGLWLYGLSKATKSKLLELYPLADFEHMASTDDAVSPQYFRAAQMNRDLWFTCPLLDFTWQYARHSGQKGRGAVRLYEHNATRHGPPFDTMGVPFWRVAHLSDIPYVLNVQKMGGGADNSPGQLMLAKEMSRSIARFVSSGLSDEVEWPAAFVGASEEEWAGEFPKRLSLQIFGGPHGGERVTVRKEDETATTVVEEAVRWEKLFKRCEFINSAKVREETGV